MTPLNDVCGQETVKKILLNSLNRNRLASTFLFHGDDGVGKWPTAIALAALVNCEKPLIDQSGSVLDACGECRNCNQILNLSFSELYLALPLPPHKNEAEAIELNLEFIQQKKTEPYKIISSTRQMTIPIDVARQIKRKTAIKPPEGIRRVILFYQMEKMLPSSADSLLKLIEEPPPETIIILTTRDPESLLPTIQSRAQKIRFRPVSTAEISGYLADRYGIASDRAEFFSRLAEGSIGRAINSIDDGGESSTRQVSFLVFKALFQKDNPAAAATLYEFINPNNRGEVEQILSFWQSFLSDLILLRYSRDSSELLNTDLAGELENIANRITGAENFCLMLDDVRDVKISLRRNVHIRPAMTALVFDLKKDSGQST